jgi:mediator of RNA polymerase II transcription subunit 12
MYRDQIIQLTSVIHSIELGCMQALIWNDVGDGKTESPYNGSPLDYLPCAPSQLVFTYDYGDSNDSSKALAKSFVKCELEKVELCVKRRSIAIEKKWISDKLQETSISIMHAKFLSLLDILDKYCYDLPPANDTIEALYAQVFPKIQLFKLKDKPSDKKDDLNKEKENLLTSEEDELSKPLCDRDIIHLLCDWATTPHRCGSHRLFYVVFLIKKRQIDWISQLREANNDFKSVIYFLLMDSSKILIQIRNQ